MVSSTYDRLNLNPTTVNATMVTSIVSYLRDPSLDLHAAMHAHTDAYCVPLGHDITSAVLAASAVQPTSPSPRSIQPATPRGPGLTLVPRTGTDPPGTDHIAALSTGYEPNAAYDSVLHRGHSTSGGSTNRRRSPSQRADASGQTATARQRMSHPITFLRVSASRARQDSSNPTTAPVPQGASSSPVLLQPRASRAIREKSVTSFLATVLGGAGR